jgi:hypothetical protein
MRLFALVLMCVFPLLAHHSIAAEFDEKKPATLKGIVTKFDWSNPHVHVDVNVNDANWDVQFASKIELRRAGWTRESMKVGDAVTVEGILARDGSPHVGGKSVVLASGRRLTTAAPVSRALQQAKPTPRWPDGHVRLGPVPGEQGYWANLGGGGLSESASIRMNADGLLVNIADAAKVAPFQPWAKGLYEYRQRALLKDDPMASCLPPGGPRQFQVPYGIQLLEEPDRKRVFVISGGGNRNWRLINLDGRALPQGEDVTPTYYGYSAGRWEKDTLVVTTVGFNERFWFTNGGLPHTESLRLTERISRPDSNTLKYEVTVDDPGAYTRPWSGGWTLRWVPNEDLEEYFCDDNNRVDR